MNLPSAAWNPWTSVPDRHIDLWGLADEALVDLHGRDRMAGAARRAGRRRARAGLRRAVRHGVLGVPDHRRAVGPCRGRSPRRDGARHLRRAIRRSAVECQHRPGRGPLHLRRDGVLRRDRGALVVAGRLDLRRHAGARDPRVSIRRRRRLHRQGGVLRPAAHAFHLLRPHRASRQQPVDPRLPRLAGRRLRRRRQRHRGAADDPQPRPRDRRQRPEPRRHVGRRSTRRRPATPARR